MSHYSKKITSTTES